MLIADRAIGPPPHSVYIIAEIGVNHDGSRDTALALIDAAASAGADAVKFQCFEADRLMSRASALAAYQSGAGESDPIEMLRRLELSHDDLSACIARAHDRSLHAIVTPFSSELVRSCQTMRDPRPREGGGGNLSWDAYKTASPDIIHKPLLVALAATAKPLILSTGAAEPAEITRALRWLDDAGPDTLARTALLQCVSAYPTPLDRAELGAIADLAALRAPEPEPGPVGYSDHTSEVATGAIAVASGARILEKHLTHNRAARGPDHAASLDPAQFAEYVRLARAADAATASCTKRVTPIEREVRQLSRQSLVLRRALPKGTRIDPADLACKRPGTGLPPWMLPEVLGRETLRDTEPDTPLTDLDVRLIGSIAPNARGSSPPLRLHPLRVCVVTGSRAEFGLLRPVIAALRASPEIDTRVIAAGSHLLTDSPTIAEVRALGPVDAVVPMQSHPAASFLGDTRRRDAAALAAGIDGFRAAFERLHPAPPDWVLVLGDRIEAFAAASAAAVMGIAVAHVHGGDRAEGIADESMRHAISKLAHLHLPATESSARRLARMGEDHWRITTVGSPAIDGLASVEPMTDHDARALGDPAAVVLLHPTGLPIDDERRSARALFDAIDADVPRRFPARGVLALMPNHDPGREPIADELRKRARDGWLIRDHLPRPAFLSILKRLAQSSPTRAPGLLIGNSSAGLIEAAALGLRVLNVGPRQAGRERAANVLDLPLSEIPRLPAALDQLLAIPDDRLRDHPYGDGRSAERIARALLAVDAPALLDPRSARLLRKRNAY